MGLRIGEIGKKWLLGTGLAFDEIDGLVGDFAIDRRALGAVIHFQFPGLLTSLCRHDVGEHGTGWLPGVKLLLSGQKARSDDLGIPIHSSKPWSVG